VVLQEGLPGFETELRGVIPFRYMPETVHGIENPTVIKRRTGGGQMLPVCDLFATGFGLALDAFETGFDPYSS
jgi:hypothetical protein